MIPKFRAWHKTNKETVEFDMENAKWIRSDVYYTNSVLDLSDGIETLKIVGNIYENPEVLI